MNDLLAVFRSRSQAIDCSSRLRALGVPAQLINTPKEANAGCGLSVRFPAGMGGRVKNFIARMNYSAFYGYMKLEVRGGRFIIR